MRLRPVYDGGMRLHETNPWPHIVMMAMMVIFWAVIIYGLLVFISKYGKDHGSKASDNDALSIARTRYAKGEISKDEYATLKKDLS